MLEFISTVCLVYICYKISDPSNIMKQFNYKTSKRRYRDPWRQ